MRIVRLQAEGFKRLVAVDISPEGDLIEVRGENGNGKSSVLDAMFAALGGAGAAPERPVRDGEEVAIIRLDLGELIVTRVFTKEGTTRLKVTNGAGMVASSGQTMLDKLVGHISFDPLEFLELKPEKQAEELRKLVEIADPETGEVLNLEALAAERKRFYDARRDVNRDGVNVRARIEAAGGVRTVPDDAPDRDELVAQLASAAATNTAIELDRADRAAASAYLTNLEADEKRLREEAAALIARADQIDGELRFKADALVALPPIAEPVDVAELSAKLAQADVIADNRRANAARTALIAEFNALKARSVALTTSISELDARRSRAIASAKMPVDGLELVLKEDDGLGVSFNGVPFSQASDAQRLRVSAAVAMAANPELRVLRLKNASLLDKRAVETLREMATTNDFQIWAEFVGDEGPGIIMEAGEVRGAPAPEPLERPKQRKAKAEEGGVETGAETPETGGNQPREGDALEGNVPHGTTKPRPSQFERMAQQSAATKAADRAALFSDEEAPPAPRKPRAMTEFVSKPRS